MICTIYAIYAIYGPGVCAICGPDIRAISPGIRVEGERGADERAKTGGQGSLVEPRRTVDAIPIEEAQGRVPQLRRPVDERFGQGRGAEERKRGGGVQFDVHDRSQAQKTSRREKFNPPPPPGTTAPPGVR